jgi:hypothetical protein
MYVVRHSSEEKKVDLSALKLTKEQAGIAAKLMPDVQTFIARLELKNMSPECANSVRAAAIELVKHKALSMDESPENLTTDDQLIIPVVLKQRIESLRLKSTTPVDATFSVSYENRSQSIVRVPTSHVEIRNPGGSGRNAKYFSHMMNIHDLYVGKKLEIKEITVEEGYGYMDARFRLCSFVDFYCLDFIEVYQMMPQGEYVGVWLDRGWYEKNIKKSSEKGDRFLMFATPEIKKLAAAIPTLERATRAGMTINTTANPPLLDENSPMSRWMLVAETTEKVEIFRLGTAALVEMLAGLNPVFEKIGQNETKIYLRGVSLLYGNAIVSVMFEENPPMVNVVTDTDDSRSCRIYVKHADGEGLFRMAVDKLIVMYKKVISEL